MSNIKMDYFILKYPDWQRLILLSFSSLGTAFILRKASRGFLSFIKNSTISFFTMGIFIAP